MPLDPAPLDEKVSSTPLPVSPPGSSASLPSTLSTPPPSGVTWAGAVVAISAMVPVGMAVPPTLQAYLDGNPRATWVLIGLGVAALGIAAPTSFKDLLAVGRRFLPGGGK